MIGQTISHYKILEKLGEGGMGVVYRAEDIRLDRPVALKFLASHLVSNQAVRKRFIREAKIAASLQHPNICTVYEIAEQAGRTFIAMALVEGDELAEHIENGPLSVARLLDIAIQVSSGLQEAHSKGVVHRDIKPANVMLTATGQSVLMDFGLAQVRAEASKLTREGTTLGTSAYMSPEQTTGEKLDHRTDIWALGVVLYEMATGQLPFQGHYEQAILYSILQDPPEPITALRARVPAELERIVNKCLAKKADERYQTAADLIADLTALKRREESGGRARSPAETNDERPTIAVLPFENRSRGDDDEYFSDGISEDITSDLGKIAGLQVTPRTLAFQFKGKRPLPEEVGRKLHVKHVLEGTVRRSGDRVRINVELIEIDGQHQVWSERYDRVMDDIFEIQDDISQSIVAQLRVKLVGPKGLALAKRHTKNVVAYNLCLRGRHSWNKRSPEGFQKAIQFFEQALAEDPEYVLAHSGLADCYVTLGHFGIISPADAEARAEAAASKALELDPESAAAHASLGALQAIYRWDWTAGEREFQRAIEMDPAYPVAYMWYAIFVLTPLRRLDEAFSEWSRAAELDPVTPVFHVGPGILRVAERQYDRAIEELQKVLELDPNYFVAHFFLAEAYLHSGDHEKAIAAFKRIKMPSARDGHLGYAYAVSGETDKARAIIESLRAGSQAEHVAPYHLAIIHLGLGETEEALKYLDKACEVRSPQLFLIKSLPELDSVRGDPRFQAILRRMNLAD